MKQWLSRTSCAHNNRYKAKLLKYKRVILLNIIFRITTPEQLSYSNSPPNGSIVNVTQLGPTFTTSFVVRNTGPSPVRTVRLVISWPLGETDSSGFFYLYPAQVIVSGILSNSDKIWELFSNCNMEIYVVHTMHQLYIHFTIASKYI